MSEMVERVAKAINLKNYVWRRREQWFVANDDLPPGQYVAGPFETPEAAVHETLKLQARAALEAMREPTQESASLTRHFDGTP